MRPRTLLVLFLLVAGLASFIWFVEGDLPGTDERSELALKLLPFERQKIVRLTIEHPAAGVEERIVFERPGETAGESAGEAEWRMVEPVTARADVGAVESLLDQLDSLEKERTFDDGQAESLGLAPPRAVISISDGQVERRLLIGGDVPASESMIAALETTGPFHVVARAAWTEVDRSTDEWRERKVFPGGREDIERLVLVRGDDRLAMAPRGDDYFIETPLVDRVDEGTISRFLDALEGLEVAEFIDGELALDASLGFAAPPRALEVSIRGRDAPWRLDLGRVSEGAEGEDEGRTVVVRVGGHVYRVNDSFGDGFERPIQEWRSLEWSGRQVYEIDRLEVRDTSGTMVLASEAGDWQRDGIKIEYSATSDLLHAITGMKAEALDAEAAIEGPPIFSATINSGDAQQVLEVFAPTRDAYPATASDRESTLWLGGESVRSLLSKVAAVRAAPPLAEAAPADEAVDVPEALSGPAADPN